MNKLNTTSNEVQEWTNISNNNPKESILKQIEECAKKVDWILEKGVWTCFLAVALALWTTSGALAQDIEIAPISHDTEALEILEEAKSYWIDCGDMSKPFRVKMCQNRIKGAKAEEEWDRKLVELANSL
jgi:hypothetical protein